MVHCKQNTPVRLWQSFRQQTRTDPNTDIYITHSHSWSSSRRCFRTQGLMRTGQFYDPRWRWSLVADLRGPVWHVLSSLLRRRRSGGCGSGVWRNAANVSVITTTIRRTGTLLIPQGAAFRAQRLCWTINHRICRLCLWWSTSAVVSTDVLT